MIKNKRIYIIALIAICLTLLAFPGFSESKGLYKDYLDETYDIIADATYASKVLDIKLVIIPKMATETPVSESEIEKLDNLEATYQELLTEFKNIQPPEECTRFSYYFTYYLTLAKTSVQDLQDYSRFGYESNLNSAVAWRVLANNVRTLACNEWDRLQGELSENYIISPWD